VNDDEETAAVSKESERASQKPYYLFSMGVTCLLLLLGFLLHSLAPKKVG